MPSNYTEHYQLNQWEAGDQVKREDFNADNAKIEAAILASQKAPCCVTGTYVGQQEPVTIDVGFRPSFLVVISSNRGKYHSAEKQCIFGGEEQILSLALGGSVYQYNLCRITDTGFEIDDTADAGMTTTGITFSYFAFY